MDKENPTPQEIDVAVEEELKRFEQFFSTLQAPGGKTLLAIEKALLRTYLLAKLQSRL